jgi:hypothetical protein
MALHEDWAIIQESYRRTCPDTISELLFDLDVILPRSEDCGPLHEPMASDEWNTEPSCVRVVMGTLFGRLFTRCYCRAIEVRLFRDELGRFLALIAADLKPTNEVLIARRMALFDCRVLLAGRCYGMGGISNEELGGEWRSLLREGSQCLKP